MIQMLEKMREELNDYKEHDKSKLLRRYVQLRLDESYLSYVKDLESSSGYLERRNELNLVRKMNRYEKQSHK